MCLHYRRSPVWERRVLQNAFWCIFLSFSMLSSAFSVLSSTFSVLCLLAHVLLCRLFVPSCLEATLRRSLSGGLSSIL